MATYTTNTSSYRMNHTMLRVKDPSKSVKFYEDNFGMSLIRKLDFEEAKFSLYFLAFDSPQAVSHGKEWTDREGLLELTHNYGTENDPEYKVNNGNAEPHRGFGHIAFSVDNIEHACARLESNGVSFQKKLADGRQKNIAFALDPDGYWVELIAQEGSRADATTTDLQSYRFNHTMIRVKDPEKSLQFYRSVLGMSLLRTMERPEAKFNLYFLGYRQPGYLEGHHTGEGNPLASMEGLVELTWNYGTENDENFKYHNGNDQPQGFGHLCISVDDLDASCARFEDLNVNWKKRLTDGRMKSVAFILDPDNYWIEVIQNEKLKSRANW
ncbi:lactoylglutathione lyase [Morchella conica CCBAS932]|uniref:Lactoylglutathione lyase n=1 Tax=Morchella conica CCBAS932 TaxID=1392247 RepID=A0A3N4KGJ6_9PEZI|nr:lactoylglutathione lyase [Morchella conica CCBAS932]